MFKKCLISLVCISCMTHFGCNTEPAAYTPVLANTVWEGVVDPSSIDPSVLCYVTSAKLSFFEGNLYEYEIDVYDGLYTYPAYDTYLITGTYSENNSEATFTPTTCQRYDATDGYMEWPFINVRGDSLYVIERAVFADITMSLYREGEIFIELQDVTP